MRATYRGGPLRLERDEQWNRGRKWCNRCKRFLLFKSFGDSPNRSDRFCAYCRKCKAVMGKESRLAAKDRPDTSAQDRFMAKIKKVRGGCWIWRGALDGMGHGMFTYEGRPRLAHVAACYIFGKPVPKGRAPDGTDWVSYQTCGVMPCASPEHAAFCSRREHAMHHSRENPFGALAKRDACCKGHAYTPENTHWEARIGHRGNPIRHCIACRRQRCGGTALKPNTREDAMSTRVQALTALAFDATKTVAAPIREDVRGELVALLLKKKGTPRDDALKALVRKLCRQEWALMPDRFGTSLDEPIGEDLDTLLAMLPDRSVDSDPETLLRLRRGELLEEDA